MTAEHRSGFLGNMRDMTGTHKSALHHSELQKLWIEMEMNNVAAVTEVLEKTAATN